MKMFFGFILLQLRGVVGVVGVVDEGGDGDSGGRGDGAIVAGFLSVLILLVLL